MKKVKNFFRKIFKGSESEDSQNQNKEKQQVKQKFESCQICLNEYIDKNVCCQNCQLCSTCLDQWFSQQIKDQIGDPQSQLSNVKVSCPSCMKDISIGLLKKFQKIFSNSIDALTHFSLKKDDSYIVCPSSTCKNIGWVANQQCRSDFSCTACNYQWQNPNKISLTKMVLQIFSKDFKSRLFKFIFTKNCPYCNTCIQKNGGCKHMTCGKCKKSFCWNCKLPIHSSFNLICTLICLFKALTLLGPLNLILYKCNFYNYLFSSLASCFSLNYLILQFGILSVFYFFFRCVYQVALIIIFFIIFGSRQKLAGLVLLFFDLVLWYYFTRWIEVFYFLMFGFQAGIVFLFQIK
ncbi:zinc finger protein (macronuclear) [Tetrahymena thermophila SB210]|uniref:RBR-type E3 ubiquitin transferase n=1 Tax=Tetrahymena thermophila (strain SB210) TaxID=312017 RepID=Q23F34_TETTS|nr:zinc finger protein [Tetrahymena thermophila SB210]EAR95071.2 zinc finger protein [Tetrahymena thermophila SB210]|eukprot:XP_001015316.2 zinc finger protein [Tetrahymena thermophila SB210]